MPVKSIYVEILCSKMENYIDILKEAKEKGILLDSCGNIEREKDTGLYTDLCGSSVEEMTPKGGGGSGSGSTVTISNLLPSGNRVATINVDGVNYTVRSPYQEQADWNQTDTGSTDFIKNKPAETKIVDSASTDEQYPTAKAVYTAIKNGGGGGNSPFVPGEGENSAVLDNGINIAQGDNSVAKGVGSIAQGNGSSAEGGGIVELSTLVFSGEPSATEYVIISDERGDIWNLPVDTEIKYNGITTKFLGITWHDNNDYFETEETLSDEEITEGKGLCRVFGGTFAIGTASHSEGTQTFALGTASHAEGDGTNNAIKTTFVFSNDGRNTVFAITDDPNNESSYLLDQAIPYSGGFLYPLVKFGEKFTSIVDVYIDSNGKIVGFETIGALSDEELSDASGLIIIKPYGAYGDGSHVEGVQTLALSEGAHAEGGNSIAEGRYSHAEGYGHAEHNYAHAEGSSFAIGEYSHAESGGISAGEGSHAEGFSMAIGANSHAEGVGEFRRITISSEAYSSTFYLSEPISLTDMPVGSVVIIEQMPYAIIGRNDENSFELDVNFPFDIDNMRAQYSYTGAFGESSHTEGENNTAKGDASHAEGGSTVAIGNYSHAEGQNSYAIGKNSHAEGSSFAIGEYSHAEGGSDFIDFGGEIQFSGPQDSLIYTFDNGAQLTKEELPIGSLVIDPRTTDLKVRTVTDRPDNYTFTVDSTFDEDNALSDVELNVLKGSAYGILSHIEGLNNNAIGFISHAEGSDNIAVGFSPHVEGSNNIALNEFEHAQGVYNASHTCDECDNEEDDASLKTLHSIGNGSEEGGRKNAVEVMQNGDMYIEGVGGFDGLNIGQANSLQKMFSNGFIKQFLLVTQEEYDDLDPKDPNTIYFIADEMPCDCDIA